MKWVPVSKKHLYARTTIQQRAQKQGFVWHDCLACEVTGALCGIENGAKMWSLFAVRANVLKGTLRFWKLHRFKVIDQIYIIVLFLFSNSMPFIRYLRRSEEKKRCHGDNNVALEATVWCVALQKWSLCISHTCAVEVLSTHDWVMNFYSRLLWYTSL